MLAAYARVDAPSMAGRALGESPRGVAEAVGPVGAAASAAMLAELGPEEVDRRFVELACRTPTIVAVDDLHLADAETTMWLRELLTAAPVLVVGTAWPQAVDRGPLEVMADPLPGVHVELVEVDLLDAPALELLVKQMAGDLDGRDVSALVDRCGRSPLELQVLLDTLSVRDAREMGVPIDRTMMELLPGGSHDELEPMWRSLPSRVQEALGMGADLGAGWVPLAIGSVTQSAAEAVLAEIAGDRPAQTWVAELDERLAVWIDPVLQAVVAHRGRPALAVDDLLELHRWVVASALSMAQRWVPNDRVAVVQRRAALGAEGFLPSAAPATPTESTEPMVPSTPLASVPQPTPLAPVPQPVPSAPLASVPQPVPSTPLASVPPSPPPRPVPSVGRPEEAPRAPVDRVVRADQVELLLVALRTSDPARLDGLAGELDSLLEVCRRTDGPMAATTMRLEIAHSAIARRRSDAARALDRLRPLMALAIDVHGTDGMPVLEGRWNGVLLLRRVRRRGDAVREADCLVRTLVRTHGADHPDTVAARGLLAETLGAAGLHAEAVQMFAELAADVARRRGPGSGDALATYLGWADALYLAGRRDDAVVLMRQADETAAVALAPDHPVRQRVRRHLVHLEGGRLGNPLRAERRFGRSVRPPGP
jgi:hypothetical protein